jgi:hypothetical protein
MQRRAMVVALAGAVVLAGCDDVEHPESNPSSSGVATGPFVPDVPTWTEDSTLHTPDGTYDLGAEVLAFVRTSVGIVFVAEDEEYVYSWMGGDPVKIGETFFGGDMLLGDPESPYVAWEQRFGGDAKVVVYDQSQERRVLTEERSANLVAIDGKDIYLRDFAHVRIRRIGTPGSQLTNTRVVAAQAGVRAFDTDDGMVVGTDLAGGIALDAADDPTTAVFSPDGRWVSVGNDGLEVFDVATGKSQRLEQDYFQYASGFEWLDGDTLLATGIDDDFSSLGLLSCEMTDGACSLVTEVALDFENGPLVAFADGTSIFATFD